MGLTGRLYKWLGPRLSSDLKMRIRRVLEGIVDPGKVSSFAQFGEDVFLLSYFERLAFAREGGGGPLARVKPLRGFYVDIGAYSPKHYSNTYLFYRLGWHGINVDATPGSMKAFAAIRPRDINVEVAVSDCEGELEFYWWAKPGLVNTVSAEHAREWAGELGREPSVAKVRTTTLSALLGRYLPIGQPIDFMSVDVEGHDLAVLRSNDWTKYRPELVLVERDVEDARQLLQLDLTTFMAGVGYVPYAWLPPNLVFRDQHSRNRRGAQQGDAAGRPLRRPDQR